MYVCVKTPPAMCGNCVVNPIADPKNILTKLAAFSPGLYTPIYSLLPDELHLHRVRSKCQIYKIPKIFPLFDTVQYLTLIDTDQIYKLFSTKSRIAPIF